MARWRQITGNGWVQWADLRLADAWFREAQRLSSPTSPIVGIDAQKAVILKAWTALGNAFRAIDTPPYNSPLVRGTIRRAYGTRGFGTDPNQFGTYWTDGTNPGTSDGYSAFAREVRRLYLTQRPGGTGDIIEFKIRYLLDQAGLPVDPCALPGSDCYNPQPYWMDNDGPSPRQIFTGEVDWSNWGLWDGGSFAWLAAEHVGKVLPPARWSLGLVREIADQAVALGALEVMTQARLNAVLLNFRMAAKHHLLTNDALNRAAAMVPSDLEYATWSDSSRGPKQAAEEIIAVGNAVGGLYGTLIGAAGTALSWAPATVGTEFTDMFGRAEPLYERPNISGGGGDAESPSRLRIPDPPGYVPPQDVPTPQPFIPIQPPSVILDTLARKLGLNGQRMLPPTLTEEHGGWLLNLPTLQRLAQFRAEYCQLPASGLHNQAEVMAWNNSHPWCPYRPFDSGHRGPSGRTVLIAALAVGGVYIGYRILSGSSSTEGR